ncbi:MAG: TetR family transcriptional regulator [Lachnospiraceae bacterium]|nr:TetR family transcriptional regulator [Lachnospiraceae bacterium]
MNPKFFDVKKEKQDAIINACLKIFSENGYKKSSTDVIVKEAGISKGLLFHYFESKKGAYQFIFDYSLKYMILELTQSVNKNEHDFFEIQRTIEGVKTRVMKNYPYMQQYLDSIRFETHPDALSAIGQDRDVLRDTYNAIYRQADMTKFDDYIDVNRVIQMIGWMSEGFIKDRFRDKDPDLDEMNEEFTKYLIMLRDHLYKTEIRRTSMGLGGSPLNMRSILAKDNSGDHESSQGKEKSSKPISSLSMALMNADRRNPSSNEARESSNEASNVDNVMGYMKQEKTTSALLRELNKSPEQLSFEERLAIKDTSVFGVPAPKKSEKKEDKEDKEKKADAENAEAKKAEDTKTEAAEVKAEDDDIKIAESPKDKRKEENKDSEALNEDKAGADKDNKEGSAATAIPDSKGADNASNGDLNEGDTEFYSKDQDNNDDSDMIIAPERKDRGRALTESIIGQVVVPDAKENVTDEVADFLNKISQGSIKIDNSDHENMVDHDGIKVTRISRRKLGEEDVEDFDHEDTSDADPENDTDPFRTAVKEALNEVSGSSDTPARSGNSLNDPSGGSYDNDQGFGGYSFNTGDFGVNTSDPDMQDLSGQYYPGGMQGDASYYGSGENAPYGQSPDYGSGENMGYGQPSDYNLYPDQDNIGYSADDMAALAQLYNNVNYNYGNTGYEEPGSYYMDQQYDMNANTNEIPVNEVLAYRNAFADQYMRDEIEKLNANSDNSALNEGSDRGANASNASNSKGDKPKKKSFFGGLFGQKNKDGEE